MGQYHYVVNTTKKQYLHPHQFDEGLKLLEFGMSSHGTMTALALLLAQDNGRGGGDASSRDPLIGSWAGDSIVIAGDYGDKDEATGENLHRRAHREYENISMRMVAIIRGEE